MVEELKEQVRQQEKHSRWRVAFGKYTKEPGVMGYCYSPKTGVWGTYYHTEHIQFVAHEKSEEDALKVILFWLAIER